MADKTTGGPAKGTAHGGDQTAMPGQAQGRLPFGIQTPNSTGAPGSAGNAVGSPEPTLTAPVPGSVFGAPADDTSTGAPGTSGANAGSASGASYTVDTIGGSPRQDMTGGSVDTEAQGNKYGSSTLTGLAGHQPKGTGAPASGAGGSVSSGSERIN